MRSSLQHTEKTTKPAHAVITGFEEKNKVLQSITVGRTPQEVFFFWRDFSNLSFFMKDIHRVQVLSRTLSHWEVKLKSGLKTEWDAEITQEMEGKQISWASTEGSPVTTVGTVIFEKAPADLGTVVRLSMYYEIPGGKLSELATSLTAESPDILIQTNLKRLKAFLETGEIATTEGQPSGRKEKSETSLRH